MSPTLLEAVVAIILIIVAWQIGVALAPLILRELRSMRESFDDASEQIIEEEEIEQYRTKEQYNGTDGKYHSTK